MFVYVTAPATTWRDKALHYALFAVLAALIMPVFLFLSLATLLFAAMPIPIWFSLSSFGAIAAALLFYRLKRRAAQSRAT
jgi:hypothetical protein